METRSKQVYIPMATTKEELGVEIAGTLPNLIGHSDSTNKIIQEYYEYLKQMLFVIGLLETKRKEFSLEYFLAKQIIDQAENNEISNNYPSNPAVKLNFNSKITTTKLTEADSKHIKKLHSNHVISQKILVMLRDHNLAEIVALHHKNRSEKS